MLIVFIAAGGILFLLRIPTRSAVKAVRDPLGLVPSGHALSRKDIAQAFFLFNDQYLTGGQEKSSPRIVKWMNPSTFIFLQFDNPKQSVAKTLQFVGIGRKGVYCKEALPDRSYTHFLKYDASIYDQQDKLQPGDQGYWLSWVAVDSFIYDGRQDTPGIDYQYDKLNPPSCGSSVPLVTFTPQDAKAPDHDQMEKLAAFFTDNPTIFYGGQKAPRVSKWVNDNAFIFLQFNNQSDPAKSTAVRYLGLGLRGQFCTEKQPSKDFPHLHMPTAKLYALGHASHPGDVGYWLMGVAVDQFMNNGRDVSAEIDRKYNMEEIPSCSGSTRASGPATPLNNGAMQSGTSPSVSPFPSPESLSVSATEFRFNPHIIHLKPGQTVTVTFRNSGTMEHTFTIPALHIDTGGILPGSIRSITFTTPKAPVAYQIICAMGGHVQLGMKAQLIVQ